MTKNKELWITNISKMNVSLSDLNLTIRAKSSINLLNGHYHLTEEEIEKSIKCGSIYKKRDKIFVREIPPEIIKQDIKINRNTNIPSRERSTFKINEQKYEELQISDEDIADQYAEISD